MKCYICNEEIIEPDKQAFVSTFADFNPVQGVLCFKHENRLELLIRSFISNPSKVWSLVENVDLDEKDKILIETSKKIAEDGYEPGIDWVNLQSLKEQIYLMISEVELQFNAFNIGKEKALNELLDKLKEAKTSNGQ